MQALIITHPCWSNHLARGSFWGALWIHRRWGRHSGSAGFWTVTQPPPPFTKGHTFCVSGMLQPKLKQAPQELSLHSLRFELGTWPCSRWAGGIPRAPFLLLCFGSGILQALRLSPCLPLCVHLSAPWEGTSPCVCALLSLHLLCWSVHDFPLFAEALSALPSKPARWAAATTRGAWPPRPLRSHVVQNSAIPTLERGGGGTATICCGSREAEGAALPTAGRAACPAPGAGVALPNALAPGAARHVSVCSLAQPSLRCCGGHAAPVLGRGEGQSGSGKRELRSGAAGRAAGSPSLGNKDLQRRLEGIFTSSRELSLSWVLHGKGSATHSYAAEIPKDQTQVQTDPCHGSLAIWGQRWIGLQSNTPFTDLPLFAVLLGSLTALPGYTCTCLKGWLLLDPIINPWYGIRFPLNLTEQLGEDLSCAGTSFTHRDNDERRGRDESFFGKTKVTCVIFFKFWNKWIYPKSAQKEKFTRMSRTRSVMSFFPLNTPK